MSITETLCSISIVDFAAMAIADGFAERSENGRAISFDKGNVVVTGWKARPVGTHLASLTCYTVKPSGALDSVFVQRVGSAPTIDTVRVALAICSTH